MNIEFSLLDEFEYSGTWWLPGKDEESLNGVLRFKHNYIELELVGTFSKTHRFDLIEFDIMHGYLNGGKKVTLFKVSMINEQRLGDNRTGYDNTFGKSIFNCRYIFFGNHFSQERDIMFIFLSANFTYLDKWINNKFEYRRVEEEHIIKCNTIDCKLNLESIKSILYISSVPYTLGDLQTDITINYSSTMNIQPMDAQNWEWFQKRIIDLGNLLTLFMGYPVYPIKLSAQIINHSYHDIVDIYYTIPNPKIIGDLHPREIEITFSDLNRFPNHLIANDIDNWFKKMDTIAPVVDLFFLTFYDPSMNPHIYFLTLMQAIETFHRRVYENGSSYLENGKFKLIKDALIGVIPTELIKATADENIDQIKNIELIEKREDLTRNLESKISSGNEFSLTTRLRKLQECGRGQFKWFKMIMEDESDSEGKIIQKLVVTRNYYTHFNKKNLRKSFGDEDLPRINYKLSVFLRALLIDLIDKSGILGVSGILISSVQKLKMFQELKKSQKPVINKCQWQSQIPQ